MLDLHIHSLLEEGKWHSWPFPSLPPYFFIISLFWLIFTLFAYYFIIYCVWCKCESQIREGGPEIPKFLVKFWSPFLLNYSKTTFSIWNKIQKCCETCNEVSYVHSWCYDSKDIAGSSLHIVICHIYVPNVDDLLFWGDVPFLLWGPPFMTGEWGWP